MGSHPSGELFDSSSAKCEFQDGLDRVIGVLTISSTRLVYMSKSEGHRAHYCVQVH